MKDIDFLPARYHERRSARKSHVWRVVVVAAFGAAVGATAVGQYLLRQSVASQVEAVERQHLLAQAKTRQFTQLERQLKEVRASAQLLAYLRHPWPKTRILAMLASPLPTEVMLSEVTVAREKVVGAEGGSVVGGRRSRRDQDEADARLLPAERDLKHLRQENDPMRTVVHVTGRTRDIAALHRYLAELARAPLAEQAELVSLESLSETDDPTASLFHVRLVVVESLAQNTARAKTASTAAERRTDG